MAQNKYFSVAALAVFVAISVQDVSALRCWRCSSEASGGAFCKDPLDLNALTEHQKRWSLVECLSPTQQSSYNNPLGSPIQPIQRPVCKKVKQLVNDKYVISRSCYWEHIDAHKNDCLNNNAPSYIKTEFCETCATDGCNGAAQYGPIVLLVAIPVAVAKIILKILN